MCFSRDFITIVKNRNQDLYKIDSQNGLNISKYNSEGTLIYSKKICQYNYTFIDYWFDIDSNDNIYGVINNKQGSLMYILIKNKIIIRKQLLHYDNSKMFIKFIYFNKRDNSKNLLYYYADNYAPLKCNLIHYYYNGQEWHKNVIDSVNNTTLTNYVVIYDNNSTMNVLYHKLCNNFEQLFLSYFDKQSLSWSEPIQITNSQSNKIYLSAIIDKNNKFHILFSEKNLYKYECSYISGFIAKNQFNLLHYNTLGSCTACSFPSIIEKDSKISAQWSEYNNLYVCSTNNSGDSWGPVIINSEAFSNPFTCCSYKKIKNEINSNSVFIDLNTLKIIGN